MNVLNILVDYGDQIDVSDNKDIDSIKVGNIKDIKKNRRLSEIFPKLADT
jgi:hypothetical protein